MSPEEARIILLEHELRQARHTISFLDGCLRHPEIFGYRYPEMTEKHLHDIDQLLPDYEPPPCTHSIHQPECESCQHHLEWMDRRAEAKEVLGL